MNPKGTHLMTYFERNCTLFLFTSMLALGGCDLEDKDVGESGTETGDGDGDPGDGDGDPGDGDGDPEGPGACGEETITVLDDLDAVPATFDLSSNEILADAVGDYTGTFGWLDNDGPVMVVHAGTESELTMSVVYEGGQVRLSEVANHGDFPNGQAGGFPCSNSIEIDAVLEFTTADGLFAESLPITLFAESIDYAGPSFNHEIDFDSHQGTLEFDDFGFLDATVQRILLSGRFEGEGTTGSLGMEVLNEILDFVGFGPVANYAGELVPEQP